MATVANNDLIDGLRGSLGKVLVFKTMHGKTFVSHRARKPDKTKESEAQRNTRVNFRLATEWSRRTLRDPEKKAYYQQRARELKLPNAYTAAITDYMRKPKVAVVQNGNTLTYTVSKSGFGLKQVVATTKDTKGAQPGIKKQTNEKWVIHYKPDAIAMPSLTLTITDNLERSTTWIHPMALNGTLP